MKLAEDVPATPQDVSDIQSVDLPDQTEDLSWPVNDDDCVLKGWGCTELGTNLFISIIHTAFLSYLQYS